MQLDSDMKEEIRKLVEKVITTNYLSSEEETVINKAYPDLPEFRQVQIQMTMGKKELIKETDIKKLIAKGITGSLEHKEQEILKKVYVLSPQEQQNQIQWILLESELGMIRFDLNHNMPAGTDNNGIKSWINTGTNQVYEMQEKTLKRMNIIIVLLITFLILCTSAIFYSIHS